MPNQRDMDEKRPAGGSHGGKQQQSGKTEKSGQASQRGEDREMQHDREGGSGNREKISADR